MSTKKLELRDVPEFSGAKGDNVRRYEKKLRRLLAFSGVTEKQLVNAAILKLTKGAEVYIERFVEDQEAADEEYTLESLQDFIEALKKRYDDPSEQQRLRQKLRNLQQQGSVEKYNESFNNLLSKITSMEEDDEMFYYLQGLKSNVRGAVAMSQPSNVAEAMRVADEYDRATYKPQSKQVGGAPNHHAKHVNQISSSRPQPQDPSTPKLQKLTPEERDRLMKAGGCFRCRQAGHFAKNCPKA